MRTKEEIIEEQDKLVRLYPEARWRLGKFANVVSVGLGAKEIRGMVTDEFAFRVYVDKKLPKSELQRDECIPEQIKGVRTDVIIKSVQTLVADHNKYRPLKGGGQIRNEHVQVGINHLSGTIGCLAEHIATNDIVALSSQHVLMAGQAQLSVKIGQPRYVISCCCCTYNEIGNVINVRKDAQLDCGIVLLDDDIENEVRTHGTLNQVEGIGVLTGVAQAVCFEDVKKRGKTTELTTGRVTDVLYEGSQILIHPTGASSKFAELGDSGSVVVNDSNEVIGLLWAADATTRTKGVANHIGPVMQAMGIRIAGATGSGLGIPGATCPSSSGP